MKQLFFLKLKEAIFTSVIALLCSLAFVSCVQYEQHNVQNGGHHQVQTNYFEKKVKTKADTVKKMKVKK